MYVNNFHKWIYHSQLSVSNIALRWEKMTPDAFAAVIQCDYISVPDSNFHVAHMGPTRVLSAPGGPHVVPMNLAIRGVVDIVLFDGLMGTIYLYFEVASLTLGLSVWLLQSQWKPLRNMVKIYMSQPITIHNKAQNVWMNIGMQSNTFRRKLCWLRTSLLSYNIWAPSQYKDRLIYVWRFPC